MPTLPAFRFTPQVLKLIRRRVRDGVNGRGIAMELGCDYDSLRTICARHNISLKALREAPACERRQPAVMRRSGPARECSLPIPANTRRAIEAEAEARGVSFEILATKLLELVASDDLINAVIDDRLHEEPVNA